MSDTGQSEYRSKAEEIVRRAETDKAFADQAKADPLGTLTGAGIPPDVARQMLAGGSGAEEEVTGYMRCADLTCWSSECPATCYVSLIGGPI